MAIKKHKRRGCAPKLIVMILVLAVAAGGVFAGLIVSDCTHIKLKTESVTVKVASGDGILTMADKLYEQGVIKFPFVFKLASMDSKYAGGVVAGDMEIKNGMSYKDILELLCTQRSDRTLTIPEGFEQRQIETRLVENGFCTAEEFEEAVKDDYGYDFLKDLPDRQYRLEGYLFPDTYKIPEGASAHDIINMMLAEFDSQLTQEMRSRVGTSEVRGLDLDQIVTLASIIERETDGETERAKVASVFYNRIDKKMRLQSCATVQYILGERKPVLSVSDTKIESPYNTYQNNGLPVGPIANPGIASIKAALWPEDTEYLYFVLTTSGDHVFSKTYEEHLAAMNSAESAVRVETEGAQ